MKHFTKIIGQPLRRLKRGWSTSWPSIPRPVRHPKKCAIERRIRDFNNDPELTQYVETISELEDFGVATIHDPEEGRKLNVAVLPERENDRAEIYFKSRIEQVGYNFSDLLEELFAHLDESGAKRRNLAFTYTSISVTEPKLKKTVEKTWQSATCPNALKRFQRKLGHYYSRRTKQEFLIEVLAEGADALAMQPRSG